MSKNEHHVVPTPDGEWGIKKVEAKNTATFTIQKKMLLIRLGKSVGIKELNLLSIGKMAQSKERIAMEMIISLLRDNLYRSPLIDWHLGCLL